MFKRLALIALLGVSLAGAKDYRIRITEDCQAGSSSLKSGDYTVKLDGTSAALIDKAGRSIDARSKVETVERKFDSTSVSISKADGTPRLRSVSLAGTNSRIVFE